MVRPGTSGRNGPEFAARAVRNWLSRIGMKTLYIEPAALGRMGTMKVSIPSCGDELLNGGIFTTCLRRRC